MYVLLLLSELTFLNSFRVFSIKPDLSLIFVVFVSLRYGWWSGALWGFSIGLIKDLFSLSAFGAEAVLFSIIGIGAGSLKNLLYEESSVAAFTIVLLASVAACLVFAFKLSFCAPVYVIYTASIAPFIFKFLKD